MLLAVVRSVICSIQQVLESKQWATAFDDNGFTQRQHALGRTAAANIGGSVISAAIPHTRPTLAQLQLCFPKRTRVPEVHLFSPLLWPVSASHAVATAPSSSSGVHVGSSLPGAWPIALRTRSRTVGSAVRPPASEARQWAIAFRTCSRMVEL